MSNDDEREMNVLIVVAADGDKTSEAGGKTSERERE